MPTVKIGSSNVSDGGSPIAGSSLRISPTNYPQALNFGLMLAACRAVFNRDDNHVDRVPSWRRFGMPLDASGNLNSGGAIAVGSDLNFDDGPVGINGRYTFGEDERRSSGCYADVGTGRPNLTSQAMVSVA